MEQTFQTTSLPRVPATDSLPINYAWSWGGSQTKWFKKNCLANFFFIFIIIGPREYNFKSYPLDVLPTFAKKIMNTHRKCLYQVFNVYTC